MTKNKDKINKVRIWIPGYYKTIFIKDGLEVPDNKIEKKRVFENKFRKVRNEDKYIIYSGSLKVATINYDESSFYDYLSFEDGFQISTVELEEILQICEKEISDIETKNALKRLKKNLLKLRG